MSPLILIGVFIFSTIIGYILINNVPSLLHTPLMSGMNALSGITILGALVTAAVLLKEINEIVAIVVAGLAIILAMVNVVGGFLVTDRMLKLFRKSEDK